MRTTALEVVHSLDLSGGVAVATGAAGGLDLETMRALAAYGARVVAAVRNVEQARLAVNEFHGSIEMVLLLESVPIATDHDHLLDIVGGGAPSSAARSLTRFRWLQLRISAQFRLAEHFAQLAILRVVADGGQYVASAPAVKQKCTPWFAFKRECDEGPNRCEA